MNAGIPMTRQSLAPFSADGFKSEHRHRSSSPIILMQGKTQEYSGSVVFGYSLSIWGCALKYDSLVLTQERGRKTLFFMAVHKI